MSMNDPNPISSDAFDTHKLRIEAVGQKLHAGCPDGHEHVRAAQRSVVTHIALTPAHDLRFEDGRWWIDPRLDGVPQPDIGIPLIKASTELRMAALAALTPLMDAMAVQANTAQKVAASPSIKSFMGIAGARYSYYINAGAPGVTGMRHGPVYSRDEADAKAEELRATFAVGVPNTWVRIGRAECGHTHAMLLAAWFRRNFKWSKETVSPGTLYTDGG